MPKDYGASLEIPDLCGDYAWMSRIGREVGQAAWSNLLADFVTGAERTGCDADTRDVSRNHRAPAQAEAHAETGEVMAERDDGGPAFPFSGLAPDGPTVYKDNEGMTLRDYFAAQALVGLVQVYPFADTEPMADDVVKGSYRLADAMLRERAE